MKKSELKKKWYYRLWLILTIIVIGVSTVMGLIIFVKMVNWDVTHFCSGSDFDLWWCMNISPFTSFLWDILLILIKLVITISIVYGVMYGIWRAIVFIIFGKIK